VGIKTVTAKSKGQAYWWLENNSHHRAWTVFKKGGNPESGSWGLCLQNYHERIFIPLDIWKQMPVLYGGIFDTRMYRATKYGRELARRWFKEQQ
jgi:hypothetical protein